MWLSQKMTEQTQEQTQIRMGVISLGGETPAVLSDGEWRQASLTGPGGYAWRPSVGQRVLAVQCGGETCVVGQIQTPSDLVPGEVRLTAGTSCIRLLPDGEIRLEGRIFLNGTEWEAEHDGDPA